MDLGSFLADDTFGGGSWADEEVDLNTIGVSLETKFCWINCGSIVMLVVETILHQRVLVSDPVLVQVLVMMNSKKEKNFYSDQPPYRARVSNLPWGS